VAFLCLPKELISITKLKLFILNRKIAFERIRLNYIVGKSNKLSSEIVLKQSRVLDNLVIQHNNLMNIAKTSSNIDGVFFN
jgi:hypothetical protein